MIKMARPKENVILSDAFEQKCQREKEKLKLEIKINLKADIIRLLTEEIHPDVNITDGVDTVPSHLFILQARAKRVFEMLKIDSDKCDSIDKINIPWSSCRKLEDFVKQLYYTENVNSLIDEIEDTLNHKTIQKIDDLNHNSCYTNHEQTVDSSPESNTQNTDEIHLSDVNLQINSVGDNLNCNSVSISRCGNGESRNRETVSEIEKKNNSVADDNVSTSVAYNNVPTSVAYNNVPTSVAYNNVPTSAADDNVPTSVVYNNVATSEASDHVATSVADDNVLTSAAYNNVPTSAADDNVSTSAADDNVSTSAADDNVPTSVAYNNVPTSVADDNVSTSVADNNVPTSVAYNNVPTSIAYNNVSTSAADDNVPTSVAYNNVPTSVADDNVSTSVADNNVPTSVAYNNVPTSIAYNNVSTSAADDNVSTSATNNNVSKSVAYDNVPTSVAYYNVSKSVANDNVPTSVAYYNGPTSVADNNVLTSAEDDNVSTSAADDNGPTSVADGNVSTSVADNNGPTSVANDNVPTSAANNNGSTSAADDNVSTSAADDNVPTSVADGNVSTSVAYNNVSKSVAYNNVSTSVADDNVSTAYDNVSTLVADDNVSTSVADDNVSTSIADDTNLPDLIKLSYGLSLPHQCCSTLGEDLLRAFLQEICCDCSLVVAGQKFKAHRCILAARSEYFEAMLGGQWRESENQTIELEGISPGAVEQALLYLYGGVIDVIETCNIPDLLVVGDMYGMQGLKHVSAFQITKNYCHFFHKPCSSCSSLAGDALTLAVTYNLPDLQQKCVKWINRYFTKFWSSRSFASQHEDILTLCCDQLISQISEQNVVDMIMDSHKLQGNIPHVKWAEPILHLTSQLMTATIQFISNNFISIMRSKQFLGWEKGAAWNLSVLKDIFGQVIESVSPSNGCRIYQALLRLDEYNELLEDSSGREDLHELVKYLLTKCEGFLRINIHQVTLTDDWSVLSEDIRSKILKCASYVCFDSSNNITRKKPPKLPSSRKANISGAVIQSLRDDHEFQKKATSYQKNGTNNRKLNSHPGSHTRSKHTSNKTQATSTTSTANSYLSSTSRQNGQQQSDKSSSHMVKKDGFTPQGERGDVAVDTQVSSSSEEATLSLVKDVSLKAVPSPHRQMSWSPDRIPSASITSPTMTTKIPIFRSSSLSPFQGTSSSRSPDTNSCDTGSPSELSTSLKIQGESNPVEEISYSTESEANPWVESTVSATEEIKENIPIVQSNLTRLLPLFEVIFHKPGQ